jgi:hypothetical protein
MPAIGKTKDAPIRQIWINRPHCWEAGCCRKRRMSQTERECLASAHPARWDPCQGAYFGC